jgi:hypothetical protein
MRIADHVATRDIQTDVDGAIDDAYRPPPEASQTS